MLGERKIADFTLAATSSGTAVKQTNTLDPLDLSRCREIELELIITAAASAAGDLLNVKLQDSKNGGTTWNTRANLQVAGNQAATAGNPFVKRAVITNAIALQSSEKVYVESGSNGGSEIAADTVVNGPFPPPFRDTVTTGTRVSSWRVIWSQTSSSGTDSFAGELKIHAHEWNVA